MARTPAVLPGVLSPHHHLGTGVIARAFPLRAEQKALRESGPASRRRPVLPADVGACIVIAAGLFRVLGRLGANVQWCGEHQTPIPVDARRCRSPLGVVPKGLAPVPGLALAGNVG